MLRCVRLPSRHIETTPAAHSRAYTTRTTRTVGQICSVAAPLRFRLEIGAKDTWPVPRREATVGDMSTTVLLTEHEPATRGLLEQQLRDDGFESLEDVRDAFDEDDIPSDSRLARLIAEHLRESPSLHSRRHSRC